MLRGSAVQPVLEELAAGASMAGALLVASDGRLLAFADTGGGGSASAAVADRERERDRLVGCVAARALSEYAAVTQGRFAADAVFLWLACEAGAVAAAPLAAPREGEPFFLLAAYGGDGASLSTARACIEAARAALAPHVERLGLLDMPQPRAQAVAVAAAAVAAVASSSAAAAVAMEGSSAQQPLPG